MPTAASDLVADLAALTPRPDLGTTLWRHPGLIRRLYEPAVAHAVEACRGHRRVLEVGCGYGTIALELARAGHEVVALDASEEACAVARRTLAGTTGLVVHAHFGEDDLHAGAFDAVRFGRSLHHLDDVDAAAERAALLLDPAGVVVVDEFCAERIDGRTAAWFAELASSLAAAGQVDPGALDRTDDIAGLWAEKRLEHRLHTGPEMWASLDARFVLAEPVWYAYLWRELAKRVPDADRAERVAAAVAASEAALIARGAIPGVAFRTNGPLR